MIDAIILFYIYTHVLRILFDNFVRKQNVVLVYRFKFLETQENRFLWNVYYPENVLRRWII